jgi:Family of unknown function (DUF6498)
MLKKILQNPAILFLLAGNFYCIWYYQNHPESFATIIWIYWFQSITIGLFNVLDLLTLKNHEAHGSKINTPPVEVGNKGCAAGFFAMHFGLFHLVYGIFLLVGYGISSVNKMVFLLGIATFFLESTLNFIRQKKMEQTVNFNIGDRFLLPYVRIFPMHLMILLPIFFKWTPSLLFLSLKMIADILSYLFYIRKVGGNEAAPIAQKI